jgi:hypothetical protein
VVLVDRLKQKPILPPAPENHEWVFHERTFEPQLWNQTQRRIDRELTAKTLVGHHLA